tara:strand:- start:310 stop:570 length:261 start_codon:yes stop_codon:yes gene_type:complete
MVRYYIPKSAKINAKRGLHLSSKRKVGARNLVSAHQILTKDKLTRKEAKLIAKFYGNSKNKQLNSIEMMLNGGAKFSRVMYRKTKK